MKSYYEQDYEQRFENFISELADLSMKHGVVLDDLRGDIVMFNTKITTLGYDADYDPGEIMASLIIYD